MPLELGKAMQEPVALQTAALKLDWTIPCRVQEQRSHCALRHPLLSQVCGVRHYIYLLAAVEELPLLVPQSWVQRQMM